MSIHFASALPVGACVLDIAYEGELNNKMCGFYRARTEVGAASLSPHLQALPCFLEALVSERMCSLSLSKRLI